MSESILETVDGTLIEVQRRTATVRDDQGLEVHCAYSPTIDITPFAQFAVGDRVAFYPGSPSQEPLITAIHPRRSRIARPGPGERRHEQHVLAANIDALVIVATPYDPIYNPRLVDRYLALAENFSLESVICLNKSDLMDELPEELVYLKQLGYPVVQCSARTGEGLDLLRETLRGMNVVLSGSSGVGKSSLIIALVPGADPRVGEVRRGDGKGRHTTTSSRLYQASGGLCIIDTPGLRELGFWGVEAREVAGLFRDLKALAPHCQFRDCLHIGEKGCAVTVAIADGRLPDARYISYRRVLETLDSSQ
jgi:ribosome biogenesis GTPase / thiamine phosphate phosphatase